METRNVLEIKFYTHSHVLEVTMRDGNAWGVPPPFFIFFVFVLEVTMRDGNPSHLSATIMSPTFLF